MAVWKWGQMGLKSAPSGIAEPPPSTEPRKNLSNGSMAPRPVFGTYLVFKRHFVCLDRVGCPENFSFFFGA